jgi:hypothetical protein
MDDQDVPARPTRDVLADAAAEQPLEKAWFAGADDDQLGLLVLGSVQKLLRGRPRYASEFDLQANLGEQRVHPLAMLFPQLLVPLDSSASADPLAWKPCCGNAAPVAFSKHGNAASTTSIRGGRAPTASGGGHAGSRPKHCIPARERTTREDDPRRGVR